MKLRSRQMDAHQKRLEEERWRHKFDERMRKRRRKADRTRSSKPRARLPQKRGALRRLPRPVDITVPEILDLELRHASTCRFVKAVRDSVRGGKPVRLDFEGVKSIRLSALIYLLAQIHKLRLEHGPDYLTGTYPRDPRVERQLSETGFFELLKVKSQVRGVSRVNRYIRFKSDQRINGERIQELRDELLREDLRMPAPVRRAVFRALTEAMTNVNHHAYVTKAFVAPHAARDLRGRWWLFATLNVPKNLFVLVFYDCGVGIPKTLSRKYGWETIRGLFSLLPGFDPDDGQMIDAAMKLGRTRTDLDNRGKGLLDLTRLIDHVGAGHMQIYSRNGTYSYTPSATAAANQIGFVEGTLIEWRMPIDKALLELPGDLYGEGLDDAADS